MSPVPPSGLRSHGGFFGPTGGFLVPQVGFGSLLVPRVGFDSLLVPQRLFVPQRVFGPTAGILPIFDEF